MDAIAETDFMEVVDNYETETFDNFICKISATFADDNILTEQGKVDYNKHSHCPNGMSIRISHRHISKSITRNASHGERPPAS